MERVGIVIVSHSEKVVAGIYELLQEVLPDLPLGLAGGDDDGTIGTSISKITAAIEHVYTDKGVLVYYDLGSAKMNAELVIELNGWDNVVVVEAPVLEGAYVGAVESNMGKTREEILNTMKEAFPAPYK